LANVSALRGSFSLIFFFFFIVVVVVVVVVVRSFFIGWIYLRQSYRLGLLPILS
jgi:hypothetical protein